VRAGTRLLWPVPFAARNVQARGLRRGVISLPGRSGRLVVRWRLVGAAPTYQSTFDSLMRRYFNSPDGAVEAARRSRSRGDLPTVPSDPTG
jgi:hypothetical protein